DAVSADDAAAEEKARSFFTDLEVIDQNGQKLRFYSDVLKGRVVLISFIFTSCQDACPLIAQKLIQTRKLMVESIRDEIWYISLSVDSENDSPEDLKEFAKKQGADESRWIFLTGDKKNIDTIISRLGQYADDINAHSTLMLAGNAITRHWIRVVPMTQAGGVAEQMRQLANESPR
ncbi:MAG: SCO family protein, partial [Gammaproteobacteria bacterium]|nr:SCO family protein [Gammaproteobacteria bacterium]